MTQIKKDLPGVYSLAPFRVIPVCPAFLSQAG